MKAADALEAVLSKAEEQKLYIQHLEVELTTFKQVISNFTEKPIIELDNILPEDLEYELLKYKDDIEKLYTHTLDPDAQATYYWGHIKKLCYSLQEITIPKGLSELTQIKIFIKTLARENAMLKNEINDRR